MGPKFVGETSSSPPPPPTYGYNDLKVLLVGEPHIGKRAMIPPSFMCQYEADSSDEFQYFALDLELYMLKDVDDVHTKRRGGKDERESRYVWTVVGFYDHSLMKFEDPLRRYRGPTFDAVAICYDPCSPRESFKLVWTKVRSLMAALKQLVTHSILWGGRCAQWLPEIRHFLSSTPPITLVEVDEGGDRVIASEEGSHVAEQIGASFVRCSRKSSESAVVTLARAAFKHKGMRERGWKLKPVWHS
jgi:hypothetical protein